MAAEGASSLIQVVALLTAAVVAVPLFKRLGLGSVLGYFTGGIIIGPFGLGLLSDAQAILHTAELGVVIFLFVVGLEMNPRHLWHLRKQIFGLGTLQVTLAIVALTFLWFAIDSVSLPTAFIGGAGFVMTSTAIVMSVLGERNELSTKSGTKMVSILLFEDLLIVPLLAIVAFLSPDIRTDDTPLWKNILIPISAIIALFVAGRYLLNPLFRVLSRFNAREVMTAAALLVVLGSALLMEISGLSMAMGAFMAGVLLSESSFRHQLEADLEPFRGLLLGLFFLAVGMALDLKVVAENWRIILLLVALFMSAKALCIYLVARLTKSHHQEALERMVMMAQGGEFAFVLFTSALAHNVIDSETNANLTAVVVISMALTPLFLAVMEKLPKSVQGEREADEIDENHSTILVGFGRFGQIINYILSAANQNLTIIDLDEKTIWGFKKTLGFKSYYGDASRPEILKAAGIESATVLVVAIDNRQKANQIVRFAKEMNPDIKIVARAYDRLHTFELYELGADDVIRETFDTAVRASKRTLEYLGIPKHLAEKIGDIYFRIDRNRMAKMAQIYDSEIPAFQNQALLDIVTERNLAVKSEIEMLLEEDQQAQENSEN